ncbi:hypothetical protein XF36_24300 [Pseudonocardia sp. HH130629-09]|nr:hypothetical protein XF36_24300 [Pseudonocardia sp. HH130629-09]
MGPQVRADRAEPLTAQVAPRVLAVGPNHTDRDEERCAVGEQAERPRLVQAVEFRCRHPHLRD